MQAKKGEQSIEKSGRWLTRTSPLKRSRVAIAGRLSLLARWATATYFAAMLANRRGVGRAAWITSLIAAFAAARFQPKTNTPRLNRARGNVVRVSPLKRKEDVYDLTVACEHVFYANGVLVSNCIDALRYALEGARRAAQVKKPAVFTPIPNANHWNKR